MKKTLVALVLIGILAVSASALNVDIRDYGKKITWNVVELPPRTVTTMNISSNKFEWFIQAIGTHNVWIGWDRTVTANNGIEIKGSTSTDPGGWASETSDVDVFTWTTLSNNVLYRERI